MTTLSKGPPLKISVVINRYRISVDYDEISYNPERTRFWLRLWGYPEVELTRESFERWFMTLYPGGTLDLDTKHIDTGGVKPQTYTTDYGDSQLVVGRFLS